MRNEPEEARCTGAPHLITEGSTLAIKREVLQRLLLSKNLLTGARATAPAEPDIMQLATHILTVHDAAELALAAVADHLGVRPAKDQSFLLNYFEPIKAAKQPTEEVPGRSFFAALNRVRVDLKHFGIFPEYRQWARVSQTVWDYVSEWCAQYLSLQFEELDDSVLIASPQAKSLFMRARAELTAGHYKEVLENLALGLQQVFEKNAALKNLSVGQARAEDAIRLASFGVHANDYLALQEFLPGVSEQADGPTVVRWSQAPYGHPGNWRQETASFCLRAFLDVVLRIQHATWIPGAIPIVMLYEHQITARVDGVEIWKYDPAAPLNRRVLLTLNRGESVRGLVAADSRPTGLIRGLTGRPTSVPALDVILTEGTEHVYGCVEEEKVNISCVPRKEEFVEKHFPGLPELPWQRENWLR